MDGRIHVNTIPKYLEMVRLFLALPHYFGNITMFDGKITHHCPTLTAMRIFALQCGLSPFISWFKKQDNYKDIYIYDNKYHKP